LIGLLSLLVLEEDEEETSNKKDNHDGIFNKLTRSLGTLRCWFIAAALTFIILSTFSFLVSLTSLAFTESARIVFGSFYALFLPGFIISFIVFPSPEIDWIERIALSFALSIAIVPLVVFYLNLIRIKIDVLNSFLEIAAIILASLIVLYIKSKKSIKSN